MTPKSPVRLAGLVGAIALTIALLAGCGSSTATAPSTVTTTATTTLTTASTTVATVSVPANAVCNNWDPTAKEAVANLRAIGDGIGSSLSQAGFTMGCEFVDNPAQPTALSRYWVDPDNRSLQIFLSSEAQRVTGIGFIMAGSLWSCKGGSDLNGDPLQLFPAEPIEAANLMNSGCVIISR